MVSPFTVTRPTGRASFESVIRDWDELPVDAFSVELTGHLSRLRQLDQRIGVPFAIAIDS